MDVFVILGNPIEIPHDDPLGITSNLVIEPSQIVDELVVTLAIEHGWVGDLVVSLTRVRDLLTVSLIDRPGHPESEYGCPEADVFCELTDAAWYLAAEDECSTPPPALWGQLQPASPLAVFRGDDLAGAWKLEVADVAPLYGGRLIQWCLQAGESTE